VLSSSIRSPLSVCCIFPSSDACTLWQIISLDKSSSSDSCMHVYSYLKISSLVKSNYLLHFILYAYFCSTICIACACGLQACKCMLFWDHILNSVYLQMVLAVVIARNQISHITFVGSRLFHLQKRRSYGERLPWQAHEEYSATHHIVFTLRRNRPRYVCMC
jgi:hypothetical protein